MNRREVLDHLSRGWNLTCSDPPLSGWWITDPITGMTMKVHSNVGNSLWKKDEIKRVKHAGWVTHYKKAGDETVR